MFSVAVKILDINKEDKRHKHLGDVTKYFTVDLVKDGYLIYEQDTRTDPPIIKFKWGYRAKLEISKMRCLEFVCQVYNSNMSNLSDQYKPQDWVAQYADAQKEDNEDPLGVDADELVDDDDDQPAPVPKKEKTSATQKQH